MNSPKNNTQPSNAFEAIFKQIESREESSPQPHTTTNFSKSKPVEKSTSKTVNSSTTKQKVSPVEPKTSKQLNKSTSELTEPSGARKLRSGQKAKGKTFFLHESIHEMFKYIKFKYKKDESLYANEVFEEYFELKFGKEWKKLIS